MKNIGAHLLALFSLGPLTSILAAPPASNDIGYQVYLLKKRVDEHGQRLEVVERRTRNFSGRNITEKQSLPLTQNTSARPAPATIAADTDYTVRSGDSLWGLAKRFKVDVNSLKQKNNLSGTGIFAGQRLVIPGASNATATPRVVNPSPSSETPPAANNAPTNRQTTLTHTVAQGDTLFEIARNHGSTIDQIQQANGITDARSIQIGQRLIIPVLIDASLVANAQTNRPLPITAHAPQAAHRKQPAGRNIRRPSEVRLQGRHVATARATDNKSGGESQDLISYTIKSHDTLESVAELFATSVPKLREINNLSDNDQPLMGKMILVPTSGIFYDITS